MDNASCVIVGVQATPARLSQESAAARDMIERYRERYGYLPQTLGADTTYGNGELLPIYLAFILFELGLSVWLNNAWLLVTLVPAVGVMAMIVIPREERFLERNFKEQYSRYKARVRRWF